MIYDIYHETTFKYQSLVTFSHNIARLKPRNNSTQKVLECTITIDPEASEMHDFVDIFGNTNTHLLIRDPHQRLTVIGRFKVELMETQIQKQLDYRKQHASSYQEAVSKLMGFDTHDMRAKMFLFPSTNIPKASQKIQDYTKISFAPNRNLFEATQEFMGRIFEDFTFQAGFSDVTTPIEEIFEAKKGVCQDFAQFAIAALRSIGLPARYVSGYIETIAPAGKEKLFGTDASHAWFSLYIPQLGWVDFDPTNNMLPTDQHIILGYGRDYHDIAPLKGVVKSSGASALGVRVDVRREG